MDVGCLGLEVLGTDAGLGFDGMWEPLLLSGGQAMSLLGLGGVTCCCLTPLLMLVESPVYHYSPFVSRLGL